MTYLQCPKCKHKTEANKFSRLKGDTRCVKCFHIARSDKFNIGAKAKDAF